MGYTMANHALFDCLRIHQNKSSARASVIVLAAQLEATQTVIGAIEKRIKMQHRSNEASQRVETNPGIGVIGATAIDRMVAALPHRRARYFHPDPELPGHGVRVLPEGPSSFYLIARDAFHKQRWVRLGSTAELKIEESREQARAALKRLKAGLTPFEPPPVRPDSLADVAENWLKRHVTAKGLRTGDELKRVLEKHVLPVWGERAFTDIKRSDVARLLDAVEDEHSHWTADAVLSALRSVSSWYATRRDDYVPPFVKNMRRTPPQDRKRSRTLTDDELAKVWKTAEADGDVYGAFVRLSLLTGQRCAKTSALRWDDIAEDGTWTIRTAPREKGNPGALRLPPLAMKIIKAQPRLAGNPHVFAGRERGPLSGFSSRHEAFKARCGVDGFHVHDLRRCARSLMARAGVPSEHAERVLGHALPGVKGVYDRHRYDDEKAAALAKLAALIETIVHPPADNVVPLRAP
jgi:integrase